jgi:hypothetical protein
MNLYLFPRSAPGQYRRPEGGEDRQFPIGWLDGGHGSRASVGVVKPGGAVLPGRFDRLWVIALQHLYHQFPQTTTIYQRRGMGSFGVESQAVTRDDIAQQPHKPITQNVLKNETNR